MTKRKRELLLALIEQYAVERHDYMIANSAIINRFFFTPPLTDKQYEGYLSDESRYASDAADTMRQIKEVIAK